MSNFFNAPKGSREKSFAFSNDGGLDAENAGEQSSRLHPTPAVLTNAQKTNDTVNPRSGDESITFATGPLGGSDDNPKTHYQPTSVADARKTLPGEAEDPRLC